MDELELLPRFLQNETDEEEYDDCDRVAEFEVVPDEVTSLTKYFGLFETILVSIYVPLCVLHFLYYRPRYHLLHRRNFIMLLLFCVGVLCYVILVPFREFYGPSEFPCDAYVIFAHLSAFMVFTPHTLRLLTLYHRIKLNSAIINLTFDSLQRGRINLFEDELVWKKKGRDNRGSIDKTASIADDLVQSNFSNFSHFSDPMNSKSSAPMMMMSNKVKHKKSRKQKSQFYSFIPTRYLCCCCIMLSLVVDKVLVAVSPLLYCLTCWKHSEEVPDELKLRHFLASKRFTTLICAVLFLIQTLLYAVYYSLVFAPGQGCLGCGVVQLYPLSLPVTLLTILIGIGTVVRLWKYPDTLGIKKELLVLVSMFVFFYILLVPLLNVFTGRLEETGVWNWSFVTQLALLLATTYSLPYQVWKAKKFAKKDKFTSTSELSTVLKSEDGTKAFALHLASELSLENLYFFKNVSNWKAEYSKVGNRAAGEQAVVLYDDYFGKESIFPVNVSSKTVKRVYQAISNGCPETTFDESLEEVYKLMSTDSFYRFTKSSYYVAYQNDLS